MEPRGPAPGANATQLGFGFQDFMRRTTRYGLPTADSWLAYPPVPAKELLEGISVVVFDQVIEQFQGGDGAGEMIVEISMEMTGGFGMGHNAVSNLVTGRVAFRGMFAPVQSALTMLERA